MSFFYLCSCVSTQFLYRTAVKATFNVKVLLILDHFIDVSKMVQIGSGAYREQTDYKLTRYAYYLIAQNGDSRKKVIALAQTYFAVQTRKQEITEKKYGLN